MSLDVYEQLLRQTHGRTDRHRDRAKQHLVFRTRLERKQHESSKTRKQSENNTQRKIIKNKTKNENGPENELNSV